MQILFSFFVVLVSIWFYIRTRKPKNFPPGPPRLPLVGSAPFMTGKGPKPSLLLGLTEEIKKHGPIIGFYYGSTPAVFLTDCKSIREAFKNDIVSGRPDFRPYDEIQPGYEHVRHVLDHKVQGVLFSEGKYWKELRRFLLRNLKEFGFGKNSMEDLLVDEVAKLTHFLSGHCGEPFDLYGVMNISVINALWSIATGDKFEIEDAKLRKVVDELNTFAKNASVNSPVTAILPFRGMAKWPILDQLTGHKAAQISLASMDELVSSYIDDHKQTLDADNIRDFLDVMILHQTKSTDPNSSFTGKLGELAVLNSMIDLFMAGMETTTTALMWVILHLLNHPEAQEKVHNEIDKVIGSNRLPKLTDKEEMPYVSAVLQESMRNGTLAHFAIPHRTHDEFKMGSYTIPKGSIVISSLYHAMHDPKLFKDPDVFMPERYIDQNGKFINDENMIAFGVGKRVCLGQSLAEKEFFIFFTGLLQQFKFTSPPGTTPPSYIDVYPGTEIIVRAPPPFKVIITKRF